MRSSTTASTCSSAAAPISSGSIGASASGEKHSLDAHHDHDRARRAALRARAHRLVAGSASRPPQPAHRQGLARRQESFDARVLRHPRPVQKRFDARRWAHGCARNGQTQGAIERFWRLVIASALNADVDEIALPYAAKVIRELFLNSAEAGAWA